MTGFFDIAFDLASPPSAPAADTVFELLRAALIAYPALVAVIQTKARPAVSAEVDSPPYVIYTLEDQESFNTLSSGDGIGTRRHEFEFTAWSRTHAQSHEIADLILAALAVSTLKPVFLNARDHYDKSARLYGATLLVAIWH